MFTPQVILLTVLVFFVLVTIHEWGHYYFAKRSGILIREFAIGFGPKLYAFRRGETTFTLRALPIGGYVRMAGEDPELIEIKKGQTIGLELQDDDVTHLYLDKLESREVLKGTVVTVDLVDDLHITLNGAEGPQRFIVHPKAMMVTRGKKTQIAPKDRQYQNKTVGQRAITIFAGPLMNILLAYVLFALFIGMSGIAENVKLGDLETDSAAVSSGLQPGDIILTVDGVDIGIDRVTLIELIQQKPEQTMKWNVLRDGQPVTIEVVPGIREGAGFIGAGIASDTRQANFAEIVVNSGTIMSDTTRQIFIGFRMLVTGQFTLDDLGGPVRIVGVTGEFANAGLTYLIIWTAILSLYLAIFNLLPIPALDGSRLLFIGLEALRGKPVSPQRESMVHFVGFAMLMMLMLVVTFNDISRLFR